MFKYVPLTISLVDEGNFVENANADLARVQQAMVDFAKEHGELADGAKAKLTLEIEIKCQSAKDNFFSIDSGTKITLPQRPHSVTTAQGDRDEQGHASLWVRPTGSSEAPPTQAKLATARGEAINLATGEVTET